MHRHLPRVRSLPRGGAVLRQLQHVLRVNANCGTGGTGAYAGRATLEARAHVALHRGLGRCLLAAPAQAVEQADLWLDLRHLDHAVGAVLDTVAAADARVSDEDLTVRQPMNGVRWAVAHAMRMFAVTT